jgi:beta-phosphoglucomutase family hydrolase
MIEAVLWDLDGVLVDTARFHYEAWRQLLGELGRSLSEEEFRHTFGLRNDLILRDMLGKVPAEEVERLSERKESFFRRHAAGRVTPLPGAVELVRRARDGGRRMALVTSTPRANIDFVLEQVGLADTFDTIVAAEDVSRGKPDPEGFLLAAQRLGVAPQRCLVIEDAPGGIEAARRAGMRSLAVTTTQPRQDLAAADAVVDSLSDAAALSLLEGPPPGQTAARPGG